MKFFRAGRRTYSFTRAGRVYVLTTIGVGIAAVNTANNLLFLVAGLLLSLFLTSGVLSDLVLHGLRVERAPQSRIFAGTPSLARLVVHNDKAFLRAVSFDVIDRREDGATAQAWVLEVEPGARVDVVVRHRFEQRGEIALASISVCTRYPFGIIEKADVTQAKASVLVYPELLETLPVDAFDLDEGEHAETSKARGPESVGLREVRAGEPVRDVHAMRSATLGRLVRHERAGEQARHLRCFVAVEIDADDPAQKAAFERQISVAATTLVRHVPQGDVVRVMTEQGPLTEASDERSLDMALDVLARLKPSGTRA